MKGLILCAGHGTRLRPFTYSRPKCTVPVNGVPVIVSIVQQFVRLGMRDIGIVLNDSQPRIRQLLGDGEKYGAAISYIRQEEALGLAHAVKVARPFINDEAFFLMLGDNLVEGALDSLISQVLDDNAAASLLLARVEDPSQYGIASVSNNAIVRLEEKPAVPQSDLAIVGAYAFDSTIWDALDRLKPSKRGEYELTDAIMLLIDEGFHVAYSVSSEPFFDIGNPERWLAASRYKMDSDPPDPNRMPRLATVGVTIIPPVNIDPSAKLENSTIGPYVYIGPDCLLTDCRIENSILLDGVQLSRLYAQGSIFGSNVTITNPTKDHLPSKFVIGDSSFMKDA